MKITSLQKNKFIEPLQATQVYSDASSTQNTGCKGRSGERMGKTGENPGMAADERQKQERGDRRSKEQGQKSSFRVVDGSLSSQEFGVQASISKYRGRVALRVDIVKDDDHTQYLLNKDHQLHR